MKELSPKGPPSLLAKSTTPATEAKVDPSDAGVPNALLWRVNNEGFQRKFILREIFSVIVEAYDLSENEVMKSLVRAMLSAAEFSSFRQAKLTLLSAVTFEDICKESKKMQTGLSTDDIRRGLQLFMRSPDATSDNDLITTIASTYETTYRIDADKCISLGRRLVLMSMMRQKYGEVACRIWNMLLHEHQMEQKAIAEKAMVSNIEAREALYSMLKDGFLTLQDIPRNADRAPSRTVYTWRASLASASLRMALDLYKTAGNLMTRLATETLARAELFEMVELVSAGRLDPAQLNENELQKMQKVTRALETAAMRVDAQLILFEDTLQL
jgi:DNA-directed RNA polymerase III subunit RPC3